MKQSRQQFAVTSRMRIYEVIRKWQMRCKYSFTNKDTKTCRHLYMTHINEILFLFSWWGRDRDDYCYYFHRQPRRVWSIIRIIDIHLSVSRLASQYKVGVFEIHIKKLKKIRNHKRTTKTVETTTRRTHEKINAAERNDLRVAAETNKWLVFRLNVQIV